MHAIMFIILIACSREMAMAGINHIFLYYNLIKYGTIYK